MKVRALQDRLIILRADKNERPPVEVVSRGLLNVEPREGEVLAIGPGARNDRSEVLPFDVKVGDRVVFGKWSGTEVTIEGKEVLIVKESDVTALVESTD